MHALLLGAALRSSHVPIPPEFLNLSRVASFLSMASGETHTVSTEFKNEVIFISGHDLSPEIVRWRIARAYAAAWTHEGSKWTLKRNDSQHKLLEDRFISNLKLKVGSKLESWLEGGFDTLPAARLLEINISEGIALSNAIIPGSSQVRFSSSLQSQKHLFTVRRNIDPVWRFTLNTVSPTGKIQAKEWLEIPSDVNQIPSTVNQDISGTIDEEFLAKLRTDRDWRNTELLEVYFGQIFRELAKKRNGIIAILPDIAMIRCRYALLYSELPIPIQKFLGQVSGELSWSSDESGTLYCTPSEPLLSERERADRGRVYRGLALTRRQGLIGTNKAAQGLLFDPKNSMYLEALSFSIPDAPRYGFYGTGMVQIRWQRVFSRLSETEMRRAQRDSGVPIGDLNEDAQSEIKNLLQALILDNYAFPKLEGKELKALRLYLEPVTTGVPSSTTVVHMSERPNDIQVLETHILGTWLAYDRAHMNTHTCYRVPLSSVKLQAIRNTYGRLCITKERIAPCGLVLLKQYVGDKVDSIKKLSPSEQAEILNEFERTSRALSRIGK